MDELRVTAQLFFRLFDDVEEASGIGPVESTTGEAQSGAHLVPRAFRRLRPELFETLPHPFLEVLMGDVAPSVADQTPVGGKESGDGQSEKTPARRVDGPDLPLLRRG